MKRTERNVPLKREIFIHITILILIILLFLWIFQTVFLERFYDSIVRTQMRQCAEAALESGEDEIPNVVKRNEMSLVVYDDDGSILMKNDYFKNNFLTDLPPHVFDFIKETTEAYGGEKFTVISEGSDELHQHDLPQHVLYSRIEEDGRVVLVEAVVSPISGTVQTLRVQLTWASIIFLFIGLIFAQVVARRISRPLVKLNRSAKKLAAGDFNADFSVEGSREVSELAKTLDSAAQELSRVEKLRKELIGNVSHDLRTPLTMITASAEMMRDLPGELTTENLQTIIDETNRLTALVNDLLDLSRMQNGSHNLSRTRFSITQSIFSLLNRFNVLIEREGYQIDFDYDKDTAVIADEQKIMQAAYNLISNAVNFTGKDKAVLIRQRINGDKVRIEVIDTGDGIPQEQIGYIWERYYRATNNDHSRAKMGTGIGLSIVKEVMELHGEKYGVESEQGKGSVFWFELQADRR